MSTILWNFRDELYLQCSGICRFCLMVKVGQRTRRLKMSTIARLKQAGCSECSHHSSATQLCSTQEKVALGRYDSFANVTINLHKLIFMKHLSTVLTHPVLNSPSDQTQYWSTFQKRNAFCEILDLRKSGNET